MSGDDQKQLKRQATPLRFRAAQSNGTVGALQGRIEQMLSLPAGSVALLKPNGKKKRSDATIGSLRDDWPA